LSHLRACPSRDDAQESVGREANLRTGVSADCCAPIPRCMMKGVSISLCACTTVYVGVQLHHEIGKAGMKLRPRSCRASLDTKDPFQCNAQYNTSCEGQIHDLPCGAPAYMIECSTTATCASHKELSSRPRPPNEPCAQRSMVNNSVLPHNGTRTGQDIRGMVPEHFPSAVTEKI
jgi:hypothetical protein